MSDLSGKKIAFLANRGVEQPELTDPWKAVKDAGGEPVLVSKKPGTITALKGDWDRGDDFDVDVTLADADAADYDALVLPGGTINADDLRVDADAQKFVTAFMSAGKPVAPICHGAWILVNAGLVEGRTLTSVENIKADLVNAGATWVDEEFHADGNLLSSRTPDDLPAFNAGIVKAFAQA
ncbi:type 1 glutamine amidotransferase domain-containing protein [Propioniciclava soli]|uniref:Type 1 glutamine amidotransferase n=1 Tax=Propioniciclava soli TaxID=2775081 RepID=A0ABZ3C5Z9_9ACTN|nr:type 1 glutamine amidotransferase domain-containing protein [Propioniciclava soli]